MKILVLTRNNPVEINYTVNRIRNYFYNDSLKVFCDSPQVVSLEIEAKNNIPYTFSFFPAIKTYEANKDNISSIVDVFITVGTTDVNSKSWYDVVVGIDSYDISNYKNFDTSIYSCNYFTLKDAEIKFNNIDELLVFLNKIVRINNKNDI